MNGRDKPMLLGQDQRSLCLRTMSPFTFYMIVGDALLRQHPLSVVRMGDGEAKLLTEGRDSTAEINSGWAERVGALGMPRALLYDRLAQAAKECTYFAPSITGIQYEDYSCHRLSFRTVYVDNFFVNAWDDAAKEKLYRAAGHILLIHHNAETADSLQIRVQKHLGVKVEFIQMKDWRQSEEVLDRASESKARLVLASVGPGGKYIIPQLAKAGTKKVVLDTGNSADQWTLASSLGD